MVRFLGVALGVYGLWFMVYELWLLPHGALDGALSRMTASGAGVLLQLLGFELLLEGRVIQLAGTNGVIVADGCNGIGVFGLFAGLVLAYPETLGKKVRFVVVGIVALFSTNVARIASLALIQRYGRDYFDVAHVIGTRIIFYVAVFGLWMLWVQLVQRQERTHEGRALTVTQQQIA